MLSRRKFLGTTAAAGAALATAQPAAAQPAKQKRIIVDAQIHIWKANSPEFPWIEGSKPQLPEPFTIERAVPLMDEAGVDRAVIVPATLSWNNSYALEAAKRYPNRFAVMGRIPLNDPKGAALLPKWKEQPGMLGVRHNLNSPTALGWLQDGSGDWFWPAAEKAGLPVMFFAAGRVSMFASIAARHPGLLMIIDHMGVNAAIAKKKAMTEAVDQVVALAKYPNVSVKLSNLPNASLEPYPFKDLTPHIRRVFDAYGPQRCHWGTDVTNGMARVGWRRRLTHVSETLDFLKEPDKDWVLGRAILERLKWA
jgi:predicted TIM-barrel fold metal-dependent hydrolase